MIDSCLQTKECITASKEPVMVDLIVLSDSIQSSHPFWGKISDYGFRLYPISKSKPAILSPGNNVIIIDGMSERILQWLDYLIRFQNELKGIPRVLLTRDDDVLMSLKMTLFGCDEILKFNPADPESLKHAVEYLKSFVKLKPPEGSDITGWEDVSRKLIEKINRDKYQAEILRQLISLAPAIKEYEFTLKSVLRQITKIFNVPFASVYVKDDELIYTLVDKSVSKKYLSHQTTELKKVLSEQEKANGVSEVIWGRNLLVNEESETFEHCSFVIQTLKSKGIVLGCWAMPEKEERDMYDNLFLSMISQQISLLINYSWLYKRQNQTVESNFQRLGAINEVCKLFADVDVADFGLQFLLILLEHLSADKGLLILVDDSGMIKSSHVMGLPGGYMERLLSNEGGLPWREIFYGYENKTGSLVLPSININPDELSLEYVGLPLVGVQGNIGVIFIFFRNKPSDENDYLPFLRTMTILAGTHFENIDLYKQSIEKRIIEEQINIAREMQKDLLPKHTPTMRDFEIAAASCPAIQVGGDLFDFIEIPGNTQVVVIGDVSGKGIAANQFMYMTKSLLKFHLRRSGNLSAVMADINNYLVDETPTEKFVTVQALLLDEKDKKIQVVNGGHQYLLVYRAATDEFEMIRGEGVPLGIVNEAAFEMIETRYSSGDIFLMFTDGLNEAMNPDKQMFGMERVKEILRSMAKHHPDDILDEFFRAIWAHAAGRSLHDDTTILVIKAK